jgi:EAL domain-containing protein (putative c-di-GMP-specific phosphodiesterase class I)
MAPSQRAAGAESPPGWRWDLFVCHADEDKERFVDPLVGALERTGMRVWYDSAQIRLGDDFRQKMDEGLSQSRFGLIVLSPRFFTYWTGNEVSALFQLEATSKLKRILPLCCDISDVELERHSPMLAARKFARWDEGLRAVVESIGTLVGDVAGRPDQGRSPTFNLPVRMARRLFGREEDLEQIAGLLEDGQSVKVSASIEGLGGVGKTELALHLIDRLAAANRFPGGIFWLAAENPDLVPTWGGPIADALAVGQGTPRERTAAVLRMISSGGPALLVLDNVESWTQQSAPTPLPQGSHVARLVTTRYGWLGGRDFVHHALQYLPPEAARTLLLETAGRDLGDEAAIADLLEFLGGHALAIELAGAYLQFPGASVGSYLKERAAGQDVDSTVKDVVTAERTLAECFDITVRRLGPATRKALVIAACFASEDASLPFLEACGVGKNEQRELHRFHLIGVSNTRWRMHRLVRAHALAGADQVVRVDAAAAFVDGAERFAAEFQRVGFHDGVYASDGQQLREALRLAAERAGSSSNRTTLERGIVFHEFARVHQQAVELSGSSRRDLREGASLEDTFDSALSGLAVVFQPIVCWSKKAVFGYEALVRLNSPAYRKFERFVDAAARLGRLRDIGRAVRPLTAAAVRAFSPGLPVFVNLLPGDLEDDDLIRPDGALAPIAGQVTLELSERMDLSHQAQLKPRLAALRSLGFRIAIDRLGAGYAGLESLGLAHPDVVKVDMSLVRDVDRNAAKQEVVRSFAQLGKDLGIDVIALGVKTPEERDTLASLGCDLMQGSLFGEPNPSFVPSEF